MSPLYQHTQPGHVILVSLGVGGIVATALAFGAGRPEAGLIALVIIFASAVLFGSLTIEIREDMLCWRFGPGWIRKAVPLAEIEHAEVVRNPWYYGWGIHRTPSGWLYNVSGFGAVQVRLRGGRRFRLGSDEPERLLRAIERALPRRRA